MNVMQQTTGRLSYFVTIVSTVYTQRGLVHSVHAEADSVFTGRSNIRRRLFNSCRAVGGHFHKICIGHRHLLNAVARILSDLSSLAMAFVPRVQGLEGARNRKQKHIHFGYLSVSVCLFLSVFPSLHSLSLSLSLFHSVYVVSLCLSVWLSVSVCLSL